jgi:uncharacterized protein YgiB involved in biofilm formation
VSGERELRGQESEVKSKKAEGRRQKAEEEHLSLVGLAAPVVRTFASSDANDGSVETHRNVTRVKAGVWRLTAEG